MQNKDIDIKPILQEFSKHQGRWAFFSCGVLGWDFDHISMDHRYKSTIVEDLPYKLALNVFRKMIEKGYLGGCCCGCRGDFEITDKGLDLIGEKRTTPYNGY